jgi:hypothetical protein
MSAGVCLSEVYSRKDPFHRGLEVRTVKDVVFGTHEATFDRLPGCLVPDDALVAALRTCERQVRA